LPPCFGKEKYLLFVGSWNGSGHRIVIHFDFRVNERRSRTAISETARLVSGQIPAKLMEFFPTLKSGAAIAESAKKLLGS